MSNVFDYLDWRGDITFSELPLGEVDSLILSLICYIDFDGIVPEDHTASVQLLSAAKQYLRRHRGEQAYLGAVVPASIVTLLAKAAKTKRFGNTRLSGYVNLIDEDNQGQFSALTFSLGEGSIFVAYRGTDDTLIGWKENFNMSFMEIVPAQHEAEKYLDSVASSLNGRIYLGGHSKGGNLAVYAAVKSTAATKERIIQTYNNDGPGFNSNFIKSAEYQHIKKKIRTLVPESSVVGLLLEHEETYEVVKSTQSGLMQHDAFSWQLLGGRFIYLDSVSNQSIRIDKTLKGWLAGMDMKQRAEFVDAIYDTLASTNASTLTDISADKIKLLRAWKNLSDDNKTVIMKSLKILIKEIKKNRKK